MIRTAVDGVFVSPRAGDLLGLFVEQGEELAQVVDLDTILVRAVVSQDDIDLLRQRLQGVDVRLAEHVPEVIPATVRRFVPGASTELPSTALGSEGGGRVAVDPRDVRGVLAIEPVFQVELELPASSQVVYVGGRVYVRFDLGNEPLIVQWYRRVRQVFLARFDV